ncbi:hypothetical protein KC727_01065 [Candidatus Kaiserbacteria bacterium]|nr:hypothetical protein [Candidatus Kaiserbacteria bacterium]
MEPKFAPEQEKPSESRLADVRSFKELFKSLGETATEEERAAYQFAVNHANRLLQNPSEKEIWDKEVFVSTLQKTFPGVHDGLVEVLATCVEQDRRTVVLPDNPLW